MTWIEMIWDEVKQREFAKNWPDFSKRAVDKTGSSVRQLILFDGGQTIRQSEFWIIYKFILIFCLFRLNLLTYEYWRIYCSSFRDGWTGRNNNKKNRGEMNALGEMCKKKSTRLREYLYSGADVDLVSLSWLRISAGLTRGVNRCCFLVEVDRLAIELDILIIIFIVVGPMSFPPSARIISRLHRIPFERGEDVFIR